LFCGSFVLEELGLLLRLRCVLLLF
jgi:hypothetical protein